MDTFMIVALVWLIGTIDSISTCFGLFGFCMFSFGTITATCLYGTEKRIAFAASLISVFFGACWMGMAALMPDRETLKEMAVAYGVVEVLKTDEAKEVGKTISRLTEKTAAVVEKKLDEQLEEK